MKEIIQIRTETGQPLLADDSAVTIARGEWIWKGSINHHLVTGTETIYSCIGSDEAA